MFAGYRSTFFFNSANFEIGELLENRDVVGTGFVMAKNEATTLGDIITKLIQMEKIDETNKNINQRAFKVKNLEEINYQTMSV